MNLQQLWFVKYDSWVLTEGFGREEASKYPLNDLG